MDARNIEGCISENIGCENGEPLISETKFGIEYGNEEDWFLKGFLEGYRSEKIRRHRLKIEQEEKAKKENERRKEEIEFLEARIRKEEVEGKEKLESLMRTMESMRMAEKEKQDSLMQTIESWKVAGERLIMEKIKLKEELEKERKVKEKVEKNWKKTKREIITEYRREVAMESTKTRRVKEKKINCAYQNGNIVKGGEVGRKVKEEEKIEEEEEKEEEKEGVMKGKERTEEGSEIEEDEKVEEREDEKEKEKERETDKWTKEEGERGDKEDNIQWTAGFETGRRIQAERYRKEEEEEKDGDSYEIKKEYWKAGMEVAKTVFSWEGGKEQCGHIRYVLGKVGYVWECEDCEAKIRRVQFWEGGKEQCKHIKCKLNNDGSVLECQDCDAIKRRR